MKSLEKGYEVKEWFANKVANEIGRNINLCNVFAILKETPKAVYAMLNLGSDYEKCMWVPKSVLVEYIPSEQENGFYKYETIFEEDYNTCVEKLNNHWDMFR